MGKTLEEKISIVESYLDSGLCQKAYAEKIGVRLSTFRHWVYSAGVRNALGHRYRFHGKKNRNIAKKPPQFVEIIPAPAISGAEPVLTVQKNDTEITINGFDITQTIALIRGL